jgi:CheY-like chemotaxis protein
VIDDSPSNADVLAMLLQAEGVECTTLLSFGQFHQTLDALERVDVIFLDLEIPPHDYRDMLRALKSEPRLSNVPVVAYTVHISEIEEARRIGFDGFLGKPIRASEFPRHLRDILAGRPVWIY